MAKANNKNSKVDSVQNDENIQDIESKTYTRKELEKLLNQQQKHFCNEFLFNNRVKSYMAAYPDSSYDSASASATRLLENDKILQFINYLKNDIEELTGVSKIRNIQELAKIGFVSFKNINDTWIELKDWETIKEENPDILAAIESIDTKTEKRYIKEIETDIETKYIKVKLHSKIAAISEINKMMGYNAPEKKTIDFPQLPKRIEFIDFSDGK